MFTPVTLEELDNARQDVESLEVVVNGLETEDVNTRLGQTYPSLSKFIKDSQTLVQSTIDSVVDDNMITASLVSTGDGQTQADKNSIFELDKFDTGIAATAKFGGVKRTQADVNSETVSIEDFYKTSWSQALNDALLSSASVVQIPDNGTYNIESTVEVTTSNKTLVGKGLLTSTVPLIDMLRIYGDNIKVSINIDGNNKIANAVKLHGNNLEISNCSVKNLYSDGTNSAIAFYITSDGYFLAEGNTIQDLYAKSDGVGGNGVGMSRAFAVTRPSGNATDKGIIRGNIIKRIHGEEGDAITVHAANYGVSNVEVSDNIIDSWTRRAIKIQSFGVVVKDNTLTNIETSEVVYNLSNSISVIVGGDIKIISNTITDFGAPSIFVFLNNAAPSDIQSRYRNFDVSNNTITKLPTDTTDGISVTRVKGGTTTICNNTVNVGTGAAITAAHREVTIITGNLLQSSPSSVYDINLVGNKSETIPNKIIVSANKKYIGDASQFISIKDCTYATAVISENVNLTNAVMYSVNTAQVKAASIFANTTLGDLIGLSYSRINAFIGANTELNSEPQNILPILYSDAFPSQSGRLGNMYIRRGTMVFNTSSTNTPNAWQARTSGLGSIVTWENIVFTTDAEVRKVRALP